MTKFYSELGIRDQFKAEAGRIFDQNNVYEEETLDYILWLEKRLIDLEKEGSTEVIDEPEIMFGAEFTIPVVECCRIGPITDEHHCPKCGKKIIR